AGVLIKDAATLEVMEEVTTLVVDKTGTLTEGKPRLVAVLASDEQRAREMLRLAAAVERPSEHPLAAAIVAGAEARELPVGEPGEFHSETGKGVSGLVENRLVRVGSERFLDAAGTLTGKWAAEAARRRGHGETVVFVAVDGEAVGLLA